MEMWKSHNPRFPHSHSPNLKLDINIQVTKFRRRHEEQGGFDKRGPAGTAFRSGSACPPTLRRPYRPACQQTQAAAAELDKRC